jgi:hypothetical protein
LPYISGNFIKEYIIPNYVGESLAALIPSTLSLIQGLGKDPGCYNFTDQAKNKTILVPNEIIPNYSVQLYFILMFLLLCISTIAFSFLNFSNIAIKQRKKNAINSLRSNKIDVMINNSNDSVDSKLESNDVLSQESENSSTTYLVNQESSSNFIRFLTDKNGSNDNMEKLVLNFYIFMVSFLCYGVLPGKEKFKERKIKFNRLFIFLIGLQSYSTLP